MILIAKNVLSRYGEIDLVMEDRATLVFVEVRYRRSAGYGGAAASVTPSKRKKLIAAARWFLGENPCYNLLPCRFDVVAIEGAGPDGRTSWLANAFQTHDE